MVQHINWSQDHSNKSATLNSLHGVSILYIFLSQHCRLLSLGVNCAWQYYKTPKSAITFEQFHLLNPLLQSHLQKTLFTLQSLMAFSCYNSSTYGQLWSHHLGHLSTQFHISIITLLKHICQMSHNVQNIIY